LRGVLASWCQSIDHPRGGEYHGCPAATSLIITGISITSGTATIHFTSGTTDLASAFTLLSDRVANGTYSPAHGAAHRPIGCRALSKGPVKPRGLLLIWPPARFYSHVVQDDPARERTRASRSIPMTLVSTTSSSSAQEELGGGVGKAQTFASELETVKEDAASPLLHQAAHVLCPFAAQIVAGYLLE
jgi:hypothetical protein